MLETVRWITAEGKMVSGPEEGVSLLPGKLRIIDQTRLPQELVYLELDDVDEIDAAIKRLSVRGAPAIGCAAALGLAAVAQHLTNPETFLADVDRIAEKLAASRPTAGCGSPVSARPSFPWPKDSTARWVIGSRVAC